MHRDYLVLARQLATLDGSGKPRQATLRRAVSTAYYAVFHALCDACVKATVGWKRRPRFWAPISPIYRAVDHGGAKRVFFQVRSRRDATEELRRLADVFIALQDARLRADYDPETRFIRDRVLEYVDEAEEALSLLNELQPDVRLELVVQLMTRHR